MTTIQRPRNIQSTENYIRALEAILPYETPSDSEIHLRALKELRKHKEELMGFA